MDTSNANMKKTSTGQTGVHLCCYKTGEYRNLSREKNDELREWRANNPNISKTGFNKANEEMPKKPKPCMKKQVASLVEAAWHKTVKYEYQVNDEEKFIMSMVQAAVTKTLNQNNDPQTQDIPKVSL